MEPSSSSLWPQWWPPQWPTAPAAPGTPSASSSRCASGGSRGLLTVREEGVEAGAGSPGSDVPPPSAPCPLLSGHRDGYCSVFLPFNAVRFFALLRPLVDGHRNTRHRALGRFACRPRVCELDIDCFIFIFLMLSSCLVYNKTQERL